MKSIKIIFILTGLIGVSSGYGQIACNPVEPSGQGEWTFSLSGTYFDQTVGEQEAISRRFLLRSSYGVAPWLDLYVLGGGIDLEMETGQAGIQDYNDKYRLAYGLGTHLSISSPTSPITAFAGIQALRFISRGSYRAGSWLEGEYYESRYDLRYDWRELKWQAGLALSFQMFRIYGAYTQWGIQRLDRKKEYMVYQENSSYVGTEEGEYRSGLTNGILGGIQVNFPGRFAMTFEALIFDKDNYHLLVGISQTGNQGW